MHEEKNETARRVLVICLAILFMGTGLLLMVSAFIKPSLGIAFWFGLIGCAFIFVSALFLAHPLGELFSVPFQRLFFPEQRYDRPLPMYSRAESLAKKERYEEAIVFYEEIERDYPDETRVYVSMIEVYIMHFGDREKAKHVYNRGLAAIPREEEREVLREMYVAICSRIDEPKEWGRRKTISVEPRVRARNDRKRQKDAG